MKSKRAREIVTQVTNAVKQWRAVATRHWDLHALQELRFYDAMDEATLIAKLAKIEALFAGAATEGERNAAAGARERILARLAEVEKTQPPREYKFTLADTWSRQVFVALLRRYGLKPYRFRGQRHTTVMVRVSKPFVDETLWPEFQALSSTLSSYLRDVTQRVVEQVIHGDTSEASEVAEPKQLVQRNGDER